MKDERCAGCKRKLSWHSRHRKLKFCRKCTTPKLLRTKVGNWTVVGKSRRHPKMPHKMYKCVCKCGYEKVIPATNLIQRRSTSCRRCARKGKFKFRLAPVFSRVKHNADIRSIEFTVDHAYVLKVMEKQNWKCTLTGLPLKVEWTTSKKGHSLSSTSTASLDRIDSKQGYIPGNIQWVYKKVNQMKWILTQKEFINICHLVAKKHPKTR